MTYSFCPKCGHALKAVVIEHVERLQCKECGFIFYENSKPTASVLIVDGDKVLLGKRKYAPAQGMWDVIGGFLEAGEHPEDGARREVREEVGVEIQELKYVGIFMDQYGVAGDPTLNISYVATIQSGVLTPGDDIEEVNWFPLDDLPKDIAFKNGQEMLESLCKKRSGLK